MNITIVGAGFGGVKAALELSENTANQITVITDKPDFQYYPALYGAATGQSHLQSWVPLSKIFAKRKNITVIIDSITSIDPSVKTIHSATASYVYETCIMALGTVTTYFGIEGLDVHSFGIKSAEEIDTLKSHILSDIANGGNVDKRYIVIGAGPTGVELAAALGSYLNELCRKMNVANTNIHICVIEAAPRVLPRMSEQSSEKVLKRLQKIGVKVLTGKTVESAQEDAIMVNGELMACDTVIWTSGVANHPFYKANADHFEFAPNGRIVVDEHMQTKNGIYVIGDNAATQFTGLAQTALHDAIYIADHLRRIADNQKPVAYQAVMPPVVVPVGENWAVFEFRKLRLAGWPASLLRRAADFMGYSDILPIGQALGVWRPRRQKQEILVPDTINKELI